MQKRHHLVVVDRLAAFAAGGDVAVLDGGVDEAKGRGPARVPRLDRILQGGVDLVAHGLLLGADQERRTIHPSPRCLTILDNFSCKCLKFNGNERSGPAPKAHPVAVRSPPSAWSSGDRSGTARFTPR